MRVGLFLAAHFDPADDAVAQMGGILRQADLAEDMGFDAVFLGHHYLARSAFVQPLSLAAFLASHTQRVRIGFGVLVLPLLPAVALAEEFASLDVLSNGRIVAGFGAGYRPVEFAAMGRAYGDRFRVMEQSIITMRTLWRGDDVPITGDDGRTYDARVLLRPVQEGGPPIWVGAMGPVGIRRVARLGVDWLAAPGGDLTELEERYAMLRAEYERHGHTTDRSYPMMREAFVAESTEEAVSLAGPHLAEQYRGYKSWEHGLDLEKIVANHGLVGTPDDVADRLLTYRDRFGVTDVVLRMQWTGMESEPVERSVRLFGEEVLPRLTQHGVGAAGKESGRSS